MVTLITYMPARWAPLVASPMSLWLIWWPPTGSSMFMVTQLLQCYSYLLSFIVYILLGIKLQLLLLHVPYLPIFFRLASLRVGQLDGSHLGKLPLCTNEVTRQILVKQNMHNPSQTKQSTVHDDVIKWKHFRVTGHLCREFTAHRRIPRTKASDAELWCFILSAPE